MWSFSKAETFDRERSHKEGDVKLNMNSCVIKIS